MDIVNERCSGCGEGSTCAGHFMMRQSYLDNGVFAAHDQRVAQSGKGLEIGDSRDPHKRYKR